jgi:hypothetical protein
MASSRPDPTSSPLSELTLLAPSHLSFLNSSQNIHFHNYVNEPALYSLKFETYSSRSQRVSCELHTETSTKEPALVRCQNIDKVPGKLDLVIAGVQTRMEREKTSDWIWTIPEPPTSWELRLSLPAYDASQDPKALKFKWQHSPPLAGTKPSLLNPDWKLVSMNVEAGEVHAVLATKIDGSAERGTLQFRRSYGREWELGVLAGAGVLAELERMRRDRRGGFTKGFLLWG